MFHLNDAQKIHKLEMKKDSRNMDLDKTLIMAVTAVMAFALDKVSARKSDTVDIYKLYNCYF